MTARTRRFPFALFGLNCLLLAAVALVVLWLVYVRFFRSATLLEYAKEVGEALTMAAGVAVWLAGAAWFALLTVNLLRGIPAPARLTREQFVQRVYPAIVQRFVRPFGGSLRATAVLVAVLAGLLILPLLQPPPFFPSSGRIVATPMHLATRDDAVSRFVYALPRGGAKIEVFDEEALQLSQDAISVGAPVPRAELSCVATAPRSGKILVTDETTGKLYIYDRRRKMEEVAVGQRPRCVAVTPDERKAYVSSEQPAPYGMITVVDIKKATVLKRISSAYCPEGLAVSRDGRRLYVATQCIGSHDPLVVIDTASDERVAALPGFAVGLGVAVSPDDKHVLVWRHNPDPSSPDRNLLTVVSRADHKRLRDIPFVDRVEDVAFSADGKTLFVAAGKEIVSYDASTFARLNAIPLDPRPVGLTVSEKGALYALRENGKIFVAGLVGLGASKP